MALETPSIHTILVESSKLWHCEMVTYIAKSLRFHSMPRHPSTVLETTSIHHPTRYERLRSTTSRRTMSEITTYIATSLRIRPAMYERLRSTTSHRTISDIATYIATSLAFIQCQRGTSSTTPRQTMSEIMTYIATSLHIRLAIYERLRSIATSLRIHSMPRHPLTVLKTPSNHRCPAMYKTIRSTTSRPPTQQPTIQRLIAILIVILFLDPLHDII